MKAMPLMIGALLVAGSAFAKLPDPTPEAQEAAAAKKAKAGHAAKVDGYHLCLAQNAAVTRYFAGQGKKADLAACANPGAFVPPAAAKS